MICKPQITTQFKWKEMFYEKKFWFLSFLCCMHELMILQFSVNDKPNRHVQGLNLKHFCNKSKPKLIFCLLQICLLLCFMFY